MAINKNEFQDTEIIQLQSQIRKIKVSDINRHYVNLEVNGFMVIFRINSYSNIKLLLHE
jgi:hypothetical protein